MMINNFHLIQNKSELIFQKRIKENSCNEHSILIYEVEVLPKITTSNSNPIELDPSFCMYVGMIPIPRRMSLIIVIS